ncbi:hypothetical protein [uncultured Microbulbifer sp.]|uniref:hypothetical protein n=1 Tax=uncultured Microbulbifer sp. TaxID=348147 RepID=UPI002638A108|nr:hypothetical protein [uncultured Microbulbifer sp.]
MSEVGIRDLLWEWARAYPERAGDSVSWPRMAAFGREMMSGCTEIPTGVDWERAARTDAVVLAYLNTITRRQDRGKAELEGMVFWLRYYYRWEMPHVCKKVGQGKTWVINMCRVIEGTVEAFYLARDAA